MVSEKAGPMLQDDARKESPNSSGVCRGGSVEVHSGQEYKLFYSARA